MPTANEILKKVFGYESFRPLQEACIRSVLERTDTLLIMPTGGGKSLCYQIPALLFQGLTVVVSPLISLMQDQVSQLRASGVEAALLNSSLDEAEYSENLAAVLAGKARLLYMAPETLLKPEIMEALKGINVDCLAIDEAHCISDWGHDFRPEYRRLFQARSRFPKAVCLAMTATATPRVRKDIRENLKIREQNEFIASFNRSNLFYEVIPKAGPLSQTLDFLKKFPDQSGIVYCFSRRQVEAVAEGLKEKGFSVRPYHAGLPDEVRKENQERFIRDDVQIMVATIAFGMGINKLNVRFVVHYDLPKNIESYYQETGRAGRDGLAAHCLLLFGYGDIHNIRYLINQKTSDIEKQAAAMHLNAMIRYAEAEVCRRVPLINYFGEKYDREQCGFCDNCQAPKKAGVDLTEAALKFLSCMRQTGQRFGAGHVIDILRGSSSEKVFKFNHDKLEAYGSGKENSVKEWQALVRQFIQNNIVRPDEEAYGALKMTAQAREVIKGEARIFGFPPVERPKPKPEKRQIADSREYDEILFEILRKKRKELSDGANVPPYVIFSDKSLIEMSVYLPQSIDDFSRIYGVGAKKLESFGEIFVTLIRDYLYPTLIDR